MEPLLYLLIGVALGMVAQLIIAAWLKAGAEIDRILKQVHDDFEQHSR